MAAAVDVDLTWIHLICIRATLVRDGAFSAVIDWGDAPGRPRHRFREPYTLMPNRAEADARLAAYGPVERADSCAGKRMDAWLHPDAAAVGADQRAAYEADRRTTLQRLREGPALNAPKGGGRDRDGDVPASRCSQSRSAVGEKQTPASSEFTTSLRVSR